MEEISKIKDLLKTIEHNSHINYRNGMQNACNAQCKNCRKGVFLMKNYPISISDVSDWWHYTEETGYNRCEAHLIREQDHRMNQPFLQPEQNDDNNKPHKWNYENIRLEIIRQEQEVFSADCLIKLLKLVCNESYFEGVDDEHDRVSKLLCPKCRVGEDCDQGHNKYCRKIKRNQQVNRYFS